jgi:hypothetical protein
MNLIKKLSPYWFYSVFSLLLAVTLLISSAATSAPPSTIQPVTVTNTPLPVRGNVGISGTAQVNVTNTSLPVTVQNQATATTVNNSPTNPVPVEVINQQPFQTPIDFVIQANEGGGTGIFTVPNGKRLVIQFVSAELQLNFETFPVNFSLGTTVNGVLVYQRFILVQQVGAGQFPNRYGVNQEVQIYADPGTQVTAQVNKVGPGYVEVRSSISGYLMDAL